MMYFKRMLNEFISVVRVDNAPIDDDIEITANEYQQIIAAIGEKPQDSDEIVYQLNNNIEWVACQKEPPEPPEPTVDDALNILLGGAL